MEAQEYIIKYHCFLKNGKAFEGMSRVESAMSELHAQVKLEEHLKEKHGNKFSRLEVIEVKETELSFLKGFFGGF